MDNTEKQTLYRFRKKHGLYRVWLPKADLKAITNMYLMMKKGELPKELVAYLKQQRG
jgi:23S rRNA A2030 N6-methylase RlmJ